ncbi:hypothetical protein L2E82_00853 [Cichorium intybus]|uniref:Uncharacterized protein n=1 Tax=Cichorium intybus TaxID=13427 RepID=A0ACB9GX25_CICIN|nr:hypothetical protein L2E82_00853 [Cichorium intybus]
MTTRSVCFLCLYRNMFEILRGVLLPYEQKLPLFFLYFGYFFFRIFYKEFCCLVSKYISTLTFECISVYASCM